MLLLRDLEKYRENNRIEAKLAVGGLPHSLWETYSAFANTVGGYLLLGVEELKDHSLRVHGLPDARGMRRAFWRWANDPNLVSRNILRDDDVRVETVEGRELLLIHVPRARRQDKPVYIGTNPYNGSYRRDGEGDYRCSASEVSRMLRERDGGSLDAAALPQLSLESLDGESAARFRRRFEARNPGDARAALSDAAFLEAVGALCPAQGGRPACPSAAGLLFLGREAQIHQVFPGYALRRRNLGPEGGEAQWDVPKNLFDFYFDTYAELLAALPEDRGLAAALGEGLANAVIHADYGDPAQPGAADVAAALLVETRPGLIRISNPGSLRADPEPSLSGEAADARALESNPPDFRVPEINTPEFRVPDENIRDARNERLAALFALVGVGRRSGAGLVRLSRLWRQSGGAAPVLREEFGPERVTLELALPAPELSRALLSYLTARTLAGVNELSAALRTAPEVVRQRLDALQEENLVEQVPESEDWRLKR